MQLDSRDRTILSLLQADCRISNAELAAKAGMSASACWRRVRALEDAGVIENYGITLNPAKLGLTFHAIVQVLLARHDPDKIKDFHRAVQARREVQEVFATTGQADYHLRVLCHDIAAYNRFLEDFLFRQPAVQSAQTNVVLREIKRARNGVV